jgi:hypothetical protein
MDKIIITEYQQAESILEAKMSEDIIVERGDEHAEKAQDLMDEILSKK